MLNVFSGGFLTEACPLELALHRCSYGCAYCFATLNYRHAGYTTCTPVTLLNRLKASATQANLTAHLLRERYPIVFSNHSDPFCSANLALSRQVIDLLNAMHIPILYQTKGGVPADLLPTLPRTAWYITITSDRDELLAAVEPHAPRFADRMALVQDLCARGHIVTLGVNPYEPGWWRNIDAAIAQWQTWGVHGIWIAPLHLHYRQRNHLTPQERAALGEHLITDAMRRFLRPEKQQALDTLAATIRAAGIPTYHSYQDIPSNFFDGYHEVFPKMYPTMQEYINECYETKTPDMNVITEAEFCEYFAAKLPAGKWAECNSLLGSTNHDLWWDAKIPNKLSYREVLSIIYRNHQISHNPIYTGAFSYACATLTDEVMQPYVDANGVPLLTFRGAGGNAEYVRVSPEAVAFALAERQARGLAT